MIKVAINGFGRIGKNFLRAFLQDENAQKYIEISVINIGKGDPQAAAYALKYDTLMGTYKCAVEYKDNNLYVDKYVIPVIAQLDPEKAPWKSYNIDWVVEASGHFTQRKGAQMHLNAGAKSVLITAPAHDEDVTIIPGVNYNKYNINNHKIVSLGSCTTNALFPTLKVLEDAFGIEYACMTTVHAYTNTQALLDVDATSKDLRRGRAAALNIVPSTTGAMKLVERVMPQLKNKITGCSLRVPVGKVSLIDLTAVLKKNVSSQEINQEFKRLSQSTLKGIVDFTLEPLVSSDYYGNSNSVIIDGLMTESEANISKVFGWYDNEWGYSERLKDFLIHVANL